MPPAKRQPKAKTTIPENESDSMIIDTETSGNPNVSPPSHPIERVDDSIFDNFGNPESDLVEEGVAGDPASSSTIHSAPPQEGEHDAPGPSTTYIPRSPSPPLPNLRHEHFPPEWDDGADNDSDSDDEVVATLPIYMSPTLHPHLHLYQFPLHTRSLVAPSYARDRGKGISARMKETTKKLEIEVPVDAGVDVWRDDRAREYGMTHDLGDGDVVGGYGFGGRGDEDEAAKAKKKKKAKEDKRWGDKVRLRSEELPSATGYYAGIVQDGALHLHPLAKIMQMRTALNYLDDNDEKARQRKAKHAGEEEEEEKKPKPPATLPTDPKSGKKVEVLGDGSGSIKDFRNKMWELAAKDAGDDWVPYQWREGEDDEVVKSLSKLVVAEDKRDRLTCTTKGLEYLDSGH